VPEHVRDLGPDAGLPGGFRAGGVAGGIKPSGNPDVGLLVCDAEKPVSAARFTATGTPAAPVLVSQERCRLDGLRAVLANSGCANAATGNRGLDDAAKTQGAAAMAVGCDPAEVALASTGGISHHLPVEKMLKGILAVRSALEQGGDVSFQQAIQTTDASEKRANLQVELPLGTVRLSAQCKGAGMISPNFATMLCFVQTDAALEPQTADLLLGVCVKRSFDRASVDGQLSTNDTAILMCSGASGVHVEPESEDELLLGEALDALLRQLAIMMVADGEGAERIGRVIVRGGHGPSAEAAARAVANSPLVKTALHGADPNWGRIVQAVGGALPGTAPLPVDLTIDSVPVCIAGVAIDYDDQAIAKAVQRMEIEYEIGLPGEGAETEVFFSDLGHEYIRINAEYTT
jgi:glutamate N-acetyltransferase/amino-acid N-acetyltransferase